MLMPLKFDGQRRRTVALICSTPVGCGLGGFLVTSPASAAGPTLSNVRVGVDSRRHHRTLAWDTDIPSVTQVAYGPTAPHRRYCAGRDDGRRVDRLRELQRDECDAGWARVPPASTNGGSSASAATLVAAAVAR